MATKYSFPVPRSRGLAPVALTWPPASEDTSKQAIRDIIIHAAICRIAGLDGANYEFSTSYNPATNTVDLDIPNSVIDTLTSVNLGPNFEKYFSWLTNSISNIRRDQFQFTIGELSGLSTGAKGIGLQVASDAKIIRVDVFSDVVGSVDIDIWRAAAEDFPPTVDGSIVGTPLQIQAAQWYSDTELIGWDKYINAGDVLYYNVNSADQVSLITVVLHVEKSKY
jgi:hypothetical protein